MRKLSAIAAVLLVGMCLVCSCQQKPEKLRLLYWNIQNGMWDGQTDNYDRFVEFVKSKNPDICVWCEAQTIYLTGTAQGMPEKDRYLCDNWPQLAARYGHEYVYVSAHPDNYPQVVTSKYPIENVLRMDGRDSDTIVAHGASWSRIQVLDKTLNLVTLHTWPHAYSYQAEDREASASEGGGDIFRSKEMAYICRHTIETSKNAQDELWMMMGDFNSRSRMDNAFYRYPENDTRLLVHDYILEHTPYVDVIAREHPGEFIPTTAGASRIDFVYASPALYEKVRKAEVLRDYYLEPVKAEGISNFYYPSDHRPIMVDFDLGK